MVELDDPTDLLPLYQFDQDTIRDLARDVPLNTDDNMLIEYSAPRHLHRDTYAENIALLTEYAQVPSVTDPDELRQLAHAYQARLQRTRAILAMAKAIEGISDPIVADAWRVEARTWEHELAEEWHIQYQPEQP